MLRLTCQGLLYCYSSAYFPLQQQHNPAAVASAGDPHHQMVPGVGILNQEHSRPGNCCNNQALPLHPFFLWPAVVSVFPVVPLHTQKPSQRAGSSQKI